MRPTIVCLCGSTRFYEAFQRANYQETMAGKIVLSVGHYPNAPADAHCEKLGCTPEQKAKLDELHLRKIDLADEVFILNVDDYIGESTQREMEYALARGKFVRFLEGVMACTKCGVTVTENSSKYCGDGSDKNNDHRWVQRRERRRDLEAEGKP